jgi:hypothetical protein
VTQRPDDLIVIFASDKEQEEIELNEKKTARMLMIGFAVIFFYIAGTLGAFTYIALQEPSDQQYYTQTTSNADQVSRPCAFT